MTEQQWHQIESTIERMTDAEKLRLIEHVARSIRPSHDGNGKPDPQAAERLLEEVVAIPVELPNDDFSGADHDRLLYGWDKP